MKPSWSQNNLCILPNTAKTFRIIVTGISCSAYSGLLFVGIKRTYPFFSDIRMRFTVRKSSVTIPYISPYGKYSMGVVISFMTIKSPLFNSGSIE